MEYSLEELKKKFRILDFSGKTVLVERKSDRALGFFNFCGSITNRIFYDYSEIKAS
jgi:hypothetical protein